MTMYAAENIKFYEAVLSLERSESTLTDAEFHDLATGVYNEYISEFAPQEININGELKVAITVELAKDDLSTIDRRIFAGAKKQIYKLIEKSCWLQFTKSPSYVKYCETQPL